MLVLHFGIVRPHFSGDGTVADYALHVQCSWRFDGPGTTLTGRDDLWLYAGPGGRPPNWSYDDGRSLQDQQFGRVFVRDESTRSWVNEDDGFTVITAQQTEHGDITLALVNGYVLHVFPASCTSEAWRLFASGSDHHLTFPSVECDFAISGRKPSVDGSDREV